MKLYIKNILLLIFLISILSACKKGNEIQFPTFILAGQTDGIGIKYVDFEPDEKLVVVPPDYYSIKRRLDLNNDSIDDFEIKYDFSNTRSCCYSREALITPLGNNSICALNTTDPNIVAPLFNNDSISTTNTWSDSTAYLFNYWYASHPTPDGSDLIQTDLDGYWYKTDGLYVGIKIKNGGKELYGWIDLNIVVEEYSGVVRRYAITQPY